MTSNNQTIILHTQIYSPKISLMQVNVTYIQKLKNISIFNYVHTYNFLHKILNAFKKVIHCTCTCKDSTTDKLDARQRMEKMLLMQQHAFTS